MVKAIVIAAVALAMLAAAPAGGPRAAGGPSPVAAATTATWTALPDPPDLHGGTSRITQMADGRIFLAGGDKAPAVFDPVTGTWTSTPAFGTPAELDEPTVVALPDGTVMVDSRIFDPETWAWRTADTQTGNASILLSDGRVLTFGTTTVGIDIVCRRNLSVYDPASDTHERISSDLGYICLSAPVMLEQPDGRVLLHGSCGTSASGETGSGQFYVVDPDALTMAQVGAINTTVGRCSGGVSLGDGTALYAGGRVGGGWLDPVRWITDVIRFNPANETVTSAAPLPVPMQTARSIVTIDGRPIVVAGGASNIVPITLRYDPASDAWTQIATWPGVWVEDSVAMTDGSIVAVDYTGHLYRLVPPPVPPTPSLAPLAAWYGSNAIPLAWGATPGSAAVASYDIRYRRAKWNGGFGATAAWKSATGETAATFTTSPGYTYCFAARARDVNGLESAWTTERCTAAPLDDRSLTRTGSWSIGTSGAYYRSTYTRSSSTSARLTRTGVQAKRIAVMVTTCRTCGSLKVYWGSTLLKTISLSSSTTVTRRLITVASWTSVRSGTLSIRPGTSGKWTIVDGVAIRRT